MELQRLEARVIGIAEAALAGRQIEDDRVELKASWPEAGHKTARQIAGHANASGGEPILWVIGLDERRRRLGDASGVEPADWWARIESWFDQQGPEVRFLVVNLGGGKQVSALQFTTDRAPYLVSTKDGGQVQREVPWRAGNSTRTAHRHEILRSLVAEATVPQLELIECEIELRQFLPQKASSHDYDEYGREISAGAFDLSCNMSMFLSASTPANLPEHRQELTVRAAATEPICMGPFDLTGPFRYTGYSPSGGRSREPAGAIDILGRSGVVVSGSGELTLHSRRTLDEAVGAKLRRARRLEVRLRLPVDRTNRASTLVTRLSYVTGAAEDPATRPEYEDWVVRARFASP